MTIYVSWSDKRHVTLRSKSLVNGAECHHFIKEAEAGGFVEQYLQQRETEGYTSKKLADGEWELTK